MVVARRDSRWQIRAALLAVAVAASVGAACSSDARNGNWPFADDDTAQVADTYGDTSADGADASIGGDTTEADDAEHIDSHDPDEAASDTDNEREYAFPPHVDRKQFAEIRDCRQSWPVGQEEYVEHADGSWTRRFSMVRNGCVEYQIGSRFTPRSRDAGIAWFHRLAFAICNRCDETRTLDLLRARVDRWNGEPADKNRWIDADESRASQRIRAELRSADSNPYVQKCSYGRGGGSRQTKGTRFDRLRLPPEKQLVAYGLHFSVFNDYIDGFKHMTRAPTYWENPVDYSKPLEICWWLPRLHRVDTVVNHNPDTLHFRNEDSWGNSVCRWAEQKMAEGVDEPELYNEFYFRAECQPARFPPPIRERLERLDRQAPDDP